MFRFEALQAKSRFLAALGMTKIDMPGKRW